MAMTELQIEQSLNQWFDDNYSSEVDWGGLDQFDPVADDLTSWVYFSVDMMRTRPFRKGSKKIVDIRIVVQCWARDALDGSDEQNYQRAKSKASEIATLLTHKEIPIKDYATGGEPTVGNARLFEPKITDETDRSEDENSGQEMYMVIIDGCVEAV